MPVSTDAILAGTSRALVGAGLRRIRALACSVGVVGEQRKSFGYFEEGLSTLTRASVAKRSAAHDDKGARRSWLLARHCLTPCASRTAFRRSILWFPICVSRAA